MRFKDISGNKYNKLTAISFVTRTEKYGQAIWRFKCDCGNVKDMLSSNVVNLTTKSCGCFAQETISLRSRKHGLHKSKIYKSWTSMKQRCDNSDTHGYHRYGGRGIRYSAEWKSFDGFYKDMGSSYIDGYQIDRIDNDGDYEPENCRWSSPMENSQNKENNKLNPEAVKVIKYALKYMDVTQSKIAKLYSISPSLVTAIKQGRAWSNIKI